MANSVKCISNALGLRFTIIQYKWGRKLYGGQFYCVFVPQLMFSPFWSEYEIKSCQAKIIDTEIYYV